MPRQRPRRRMRPARGQQKPFLTPGQSIITLAPSTPTVPTVTITVERGGQVIASPPDLPSAITLAKSASQDGTEVLVRSQGMVLAGFRNGRKVYDTLGDVPSGDLGIYRERSFSTADDVDAVYGTPRYYSPILDGGLGCPCTGVAPRAPRGPIRYVGSGLGDTVSLNLPDGTVEAVQKLIAPLRPVFDPIVKQINQQTVRLLQQQGSVVRSTPRPARRTPRR